MVQRMKKRKLSMNFIFQQQYGITSWKVHRFWFGTWGTVSGFLKP